MRIISSGNVVCVEGCKHLAQTQRILDAITGNRMADMQQRETMNIRDNETRIRQAEINAQAEYLRLGIYEDQNNEELRREEMQIDKDKLKEEIRQFDKELRLKKDELNQKKEIEMAKIHSGKSNGK